MNILLLSHSPNDPDAGASRVYHQLHEGLIARGHRVETLHFEDFRLPPQRLFSRTIEKLAMPQWINWRQRQRNFAHTDIIMAPSGMGSCLFRRLRARAERPLLVNHQHGLTLFDHQARLTEALAGHIAFPLHKRLLERPPMGWDMDGLRSADLTILQNLRDLDYLRRRDKFARLTMIPPALHPAILTASAATISPASRPPNSLVWFGSWVARKGAAVVPAAFDQVVDAMPEAVLTIGGTGLPERDVLSCFSPRARVRVCVLPRLSLADQIAEFQRHAVFLFPSLSEGFGLALLEAMALGLAAVTTLTGFGADFLRHRETGLIVSQGSARHLAEGILEAIRDNSVRISIAQRGQALAQTFTLERMAAQYEGAFTTGLAQLKAA